MTRPLEIFNMAQAMAQHAAARQATVAANVANADTPGYRAQDLAPFSETYRAEQPDTRLRATRAGHVMEGEAPKNLLRQIDMPGPSAPNGNTVSLESEMVRATEVRHQHEMALCVYQSALTVLRTSLGRGM